MALETIFLGTGSNAGGVNGASLLTVADIEVGDIVNVFATSANTKQDTGFYGFHDAAGNTYAVDASTKQNSNTLLVTVGHAVADQAMAAGGAMWSAGSNVSGAHVITATAIRDVP